MTNAIMFTSSTSTDGTKVVNLLLWAAHYLGLDILDYRHQICEFRHQLTTDISSEAGRASNPSSAELSKMHNFQVFEAFLLFCWVWDIYKYTWFFLDPPKMLTSKPCKAVEWAGKRWILLCYAATPGLITVRWPKARFTITYWARALLAPIDCHKGNGSRT